MTTERCYISKDEVQLPIDLGDGLLLRNATIDDTEQLAEFVAINGGDLQEPEESTAVWTRDLMEGNLPNFGPQDWTLVEHTPERGVSRCKASLVFPGSIASSVMNLHLH